MRFQLPIIALLAFLAVPALGDGFLVPVHQPQGDVFTVKYHHVDVFVDGQAAVTKVDQVFHNETGREEEGTYIFPLPKGATIHKFSMFVGEEEVQGKILPRDEARQLYESIVRRRRDPALLEYMDRSTFRARVFPIPPHGDKRIRLEYTEVLGKTDSLCRYVYPLSTERFSAKPLEDVRVTIRLKSNTPITNIYSPSHSVKVEQSKPTSATVNWTARDVKPDQDLVLYYNQESRDLALNVLTFREGGKPAYFMLLASPPVKEEKEVILPKRVVFVLDRTGSMAGNKIDQAKAALKYCLNSLTARDSFNLITFNETPELFAKKSVGFLPATKANIEKALDHVDGIDANGGTNLNQAVLDALSLFSDLQDRNPRFVVLLTDGLPTVGETNMETILRNAHEAIGRARVFSFGVGYDVNTHLLDLLTEQTGGVPEYVLPREDIEAKVSSFFARVGQPMLTDLELDAEGARISDVVPANPLPDVFRGSQLVVLGRAEGRGKATFILSGRTASGHHSWSTTVDLGAADREKDFIPQIWAARKIGFLLDQVRLHRSEELIKEIVQLSQQWGIPTEFTSYFVNEPAVGAKDGVLRAQKSMKRASGAVSGPWGVNQSVNSNALRNQSQVFANPGAAPMDAYGMDRAAGGYAGNRMGTVRGYFDQSGNAVTVNAVQNIGTRTFYQRGNRWVDNQVEGQNLRRVQIRQFSNAHFKLLAAYPELARYQRLGNMAVNINNQSVEIGPEGKEDLSDAELKAIVGTPHSALPPVEPNRHPAHIAGLAGIMGLACVMGLRRARR